MTKQKKATHSKTTNDTVRSKMKVTVQKGKAGLHKRNLHHGRYNFNQLVNATPELKQYVVKNPKGEALLTFPIHRLLSYSIKRCLHIIMVSYLGIFLRVTYAHRFRGAPITFTV
ncbi:hypothetical protein N779_18320 [Vibrio coralliilyticus OCN008]|nr:hypothetical protein N779_18320 [Vibrio coralliilyticus OCN008]